MNDFYNDKAELHQKVITACENIVANPCSNLASEFHEINSAVATLTIPSWKDSAGNSFEDSKNDITSSLTTLEGAVSGLFQSGQTTYNSLKEQLDELKTTATEYDNHVANEPPLTITVYYDSTEPTEISNPAHTTWVENRGMLEAKCKDMRDTADSLESVLNSINEASVGDTLESLGLSIPEVIPFDEETQKLVAPPVLEVETKEIAGFTFTKVTNSDEIENQDDLVRDTDSTLYKLTLMAGEDSAVDLYVALPNNDEDNTLTTKVEDNIRSVFGHIHDINPSLLKVCTNPKFVLYNDGDEFKIDINVDLGDTQKRLSSSYNPNYNFDVLKSAALGASESLGFNDLKLTDIPEDVLSELPKGYLETDSEGRVDTSMIINDYYDVYYDEDSGTTKSNLQEDYPNTYNWVSSKITDKIENSSSNES